MKAYNNCCIIDDDEFFAFNAKRLIIDSDFSENVLWYSDGQRAIDGLIGLLIENISLPEIIFLDLNMPNKNGWEFLDDFAALPVNKRSNVKIFIASSFISPEFIKKAKDYNMIEDYLVKPLTEESLLHITASKKKVD
ncbi:MAG: two-component SAPR family response regulator [Maribacter sp.]|jgi:two-component SAPR family response regulator